MDENLSDPHGEFYNELLTLAGRPERQPEGWQQYKERRFESVDEQFAFTTRLIQFYVFWSIYSLENGVAGGLKWTAGTGVTPIDKEPIAPPDATPYSSAVLFETLSNSEFLNPINRIVLTSKPFPVPAGTQMSFMEHSNPDKGEVFTCVIRLERPQFFKIDFEVQPGPAMNNQLPAGFSTPTVLGTTTYTINIVMKYQIQRKTDRRFQADKYAAWADSVFDGLKKQMGFGSNMQSTTQSSPQIGHFIDEGSHIQVGTLPESLKQQVAALAGLTEGSDAEQSLRKDIIASTMKLNPVPAIPEEARRHFVIANTFVRDGKQSQDYSHAIEEYKKALLLAPWYADAYYNLGVSLQASGDYPAAERALRLYLYSAPSASDARTVQDHIYEMSARTTAYSQKANEQMNEFRHLVAGIRYDQHSWCGFIRGSHHQPSMDMGCNEKEFNGKNWIINDKRQNVFWDFSADNTVRLAGGVPFLFGMPDKRTGSIRWMCGRTPDDVTPAWVRIWPGGIGVTYSCQRPADDTDFKPQVRYEYVSFSVGK
jgi:tetratricopeptide (TPR) repeat protein